ncbi:ATPase, V1 complex, subunit C [Entophlyctis helioformis]|nr:ATPase, V1 complex, subunit C [Entophlyctis helioformis]
MASGLPSVWFLSAPGNPTKQDTVAKLKDKIASKANDYAEVLPFQLPEFKVGTLDSLVVLSDELAKTDQAFEAIVVKVADGLRNLLNNDMDQWKANLIVGDKRIETYLKSFQWNAMKYRVDKTLKELADMVSQEVNSIDALMKTKTQAYSQVKAALQGIQRKTNGNLAVRTLNDIVKKEHFVLDSEYLTTALVAVPKTLTKDWIEQYETLTQMVVPRSTQKIAEDDEYALFTVTLFQRVLEEFGNKAREKKFIVRDFTWDPERLSSEKKQLTDLTASEREQWATLMRLSKTNFGELFSCWMHIKALRTFVESILRYGLPPNFQPMTIIAKPKHEKRVRDTFNKHFAYIDGSQNSTDAADEGIDETLQVLLGEKDYCPVVIFAINTIA